MPTGYTAGIEDGTMTDFRSFALTCARAFGATIMQRDDPLDEAPKLQSASTYHDEQAAAAWARLNSVLGMTPAACEEAAAAEHAGRWADHARYVAARAEKLARYAAMRREVDAWAPPTPQHAELKAFMLQQIEVSTEGHDYELPEPVRKTGAEWRAAVIARAKTDIAYHEREARNERDRTTGRNAWIEALYASLPTASADTGVAE